MLQGLQEQTRLPPIKTVEAALRKTTERLAVELAQPMATAPAWSEFEWRIAAAVAALQGIAALLSMTLRWKGPPSWEVFLAQQTHHTALRRRRIAQLLLRIDCEAQRAGVALVALKGAALYEIGMYRAAERPMGDIDLLIRPDDLGQTARLLNSLDYTECLNMRRHLVFEPYESSATQRLGEHIDCPLKIEVHTHIAEPLPAFETDITVLEFPPHAHPGLNPYPSTAALMRHLLLHAAGNIRARALRLIQLHDIALLAARMALHDWNELLSEPRGKLGPWWALPPLILTERYYPDTIPSWVMDALVGDCPWLLRTLSARHRLADVSWSNVRIQAFPGIEWSNSPREALQFMASRVFPNRAARSWLQQLATTQPWARKTPWYGLSHGRRILRWILSRPPRVQTMHSVLQVLENDP